jgi:hypothetical protein
MQKSVLALKDCRAFFEAVTMRISPSYDTRMIIYNVECAYSETAAQSEVYR